MADAARRTTGRAELSGRHGFLEVSPEVGVLDEDAFDDLLADDPEAAAVRRLHEEAAAHFDAVCIPTPDGLLLGRRR